MNDSANNYQSNSNASRDIEESKLRRDLNVVLDLLHLLMIEETDETLPAEEVDVHGQKIIIKRTTPRLAVNDVDFEMIFSRLLKNSNFSSTEEFTEIFKKDLEFKINKYHELPDKYKKEYQKNAEKDNQLILSADRFYKWLIGKGNQIAEFSVEARKVMQNEIVTIDKENFERFNYFLKTGIAKDSITLNLKQIEILRIFYWLKYQGHLHLKGRSLHSLLISTFKYTLRGGRSYKMGNDNTGLEKQIGALESLLNTENSIYATNSQLKNFRNAFKGTKEKFPQIFALKKK